MSKKPKNKRISIMFIESVNKNKSGSIATVKPGYANYLVRAGLGIFSKGNETIIQKQIDDWRKKDELKIEEAKSNEEKLKSVNLELKRKSGFGGLLYGSVTALDVSRELQNHGCNIRRSEIIMQQIRYIGKYDISINLYGGNKAVMQVNVISDMS